MLFEKLKQAFPRVKAGEPLKNHSTFRVGGKADYFYELYNIEELPDLIMFAVKNGIPYFLFGRGSNILFLDGGYRGLIIKNLSNKIEISKDTVTADSGVLLSQIVQKTVIAGLTGLEPLYGLPGSIGGAVFGNAGVPDTEISNFLTVLSAFNEEEGMHEHKRDELQYGYRTSTFKTKKPQDCIMRVSLKLKRGDEKLSRERMKQIDEIRRGKQPSGYTCGSFFKNPAGETAGHLIDKAGMKGMRIGGAEISLKHANFFMNVAQSSAKNIIDLKNAVQKKVFEDYGIRLEEEIRIIGDE